eukprot:SAG22_NODE_11605_length_477_cov_1.116402_1_plen_33_part_10
MMILIISYTALRLPQLPWPLAHSVLTRSLGNLP